MNELHILDLITIAAYFVILLWIGWSIMRSQKDSSESEPYDFSASWTGWLVSLPALVIISLLTQHNAEEQPDLFYQA